jgi:hypothetical protein
LTRRETLKYAAVGGMMLIAFPNEPRVEISCNPPSVMIKNYAVSGIITRS